MLDKVKRAISKSKSIVGKEDNLKVFNDIVCRENILITHDTSGLIPASTLLNLFLTLKPSSNVTLIPLEVFYSVQAPYYSKPTIIFLTDVKSTPRTSDTLRLLSITHIVFSPKIPPNIPLHRRGFNIVELPESSSREETIFLEMYTSTLMFFKTLSTDSRRAKKVYSEVSTLDSILEDLLDHYKEECDEVVDLVKSSNEILILYTELLKPIAQYLYNKISLKGKGIPLKILPLELASEYSTQLPSNIVVLRTSMEEDTFRAFRVRAGLELKSRRLIDISVKTDPLTAPYYAFIILWSILNELDM